MRPSWQIFVGSIVLFAFVFVGTGCLLWNFFIPDPENNVATIVTASTGISAGVVSCFVALINCQGRRRAEERAENAERRAEKQEIRAENAEKRAENAEKRDEERLIDTKMKEANEQLGSDKASVRIAGVQALTEIADSRKGKYRQRVMDILCGYLRSERETYSLGTDGKPVMDRSRFGDADKVVESAIINVMRDHLRKERRNDKTGETIVRQAVDDDQLWCDCTFDFHGAIFHEDTDLAHATFGRGLNFQGAKFEGDADFSGAIFNGSADFSGAIFNGDADFRRADFAGAADFNSADFRKADFSGAIFNGAADFNSADFRKADFSGAIFNGSADFRRADFNNADFRGADFRGSNFDKAYFNGGVYFAGRAYFNGSADFNWATFKGRTDFVRSTFTGGVYFNVTIFNGGVYFNGADFNGGVYFNGADFNGAADFNRAACAGAMNFNLAKFHSKAEFLGIKGQPSFEGCKFNRQLPDNDPSAYKFDLVLKNNSELPTGAEWADFPEKNDAAEGAEADR